MTRDRTAFEQYYLFEIVLKNERDEPRRQGLLWRPRLPSLERAYGLLISFTASILVAFMLLLLVRVGSDLLKVNIHGPSRPLTPLLQRAPLRPLAGDGADCRGLAGNKLACTPTTMEKT